jgi:hypothetical protein
MKPSKPMKRGVRTAATLSASVEQSFAVDAALFERAVLNPPRVSTALRQLHPGAEAIFRDELPREHCESEYQTRLPDKKLLQAKLHEFYALTESATSREPDTELLARAEARR